MPVTEVTKDPEALTMTVTADFAAAPERVWRVYEDPRQLERIWGPPGWPATFVEHDFVAGGRSHYFMTGPDGEQPHGVWRITATDAPRAFSLRDAFADADGAPDEATGWSTMSATLEEGGSGTIVRFVTTFDSAEQLSQMLEMGMQEGLTQAMNQIDALLAEG